MIHKYDNKSSSTGISLSFYLDSLEETEEPQKILSVYGSDILLDKKLSSLGKKECRLTVVTKLKFNITCKYL